MIQNYISSQTEPYIHCTSPAIDYGYWPNKDHTGHDRVWKCESCSEFFRYPEEPKS